MNNKEKSKENMNRLRREDIEKLKKQKELYKDDKIISRALNEEIEHLEDQMEK